MSFKPIRNYLNDRLLEIDSSFSLYDTAFPNDYVGDNNYNKRFNIFYGPVSATSANQNTTNDLVNAQVTLYFRGFRDSNESLDEAMDIANKYRINCLRPNKLLGQTHIKQVTCSSIDPQSLSDNNQQFKIVLSFSIKYICGLGVDLNC